MDQVQGEANGTCFTRIHRHDSLTEERLTDQAMCHILQVRQCEADHIIFVLIIPFIFAKPLFAKSDNRTFYARSDWSRRGFAEDGSTSRRLYANQLLLIQLRPDPFLELLMCHLAGLAFHAEHLLFAYL